MAFVTDSNCPQQSRQPSPITCLPTSRVAFEAPSDFAAETKGGGALAMYPYPHHLSNPLASCLVNWCIGLPVEASHGMLIHHTPHASEHLPPLGLEPSGALSKFAQESKRKPKNAKN